MPIVISRRTGEIGSVTSSSQEHSNALHRAIMAAEIKLHPERFDIPKTGNDAENKRTHLGG